MIDSTKADQIIGAILQTPRETRAVELKPSIPWKDINQQHQLQDITKTILGMSNVRDGGKIILGITQNPDRTFTSTGMQEDHIKTFDQDHIFQVVRAYGNPEPRFEIINVEYNGHFYIVFNVQDFLYSPVICIRNGSNNGTEPLVRGSMYIRTFKPETKKVDDETELREIINLAIDKELEVWSPRIEKLYSSPQKITRNKKEDSSKKFERELEDIKI